ncbi:hypothetical protein GCM10027034_26240 [Ramlibacter solisilvae]|uniref:Uncharacterized protein n=1 Tax=Ramlibacter tataouinensis TaxID=94132 RepID=A0A127JQP8_9BURK|nr:hypothetical protein [Ramlibacter tataouinensis]AMO22300.1 hypothetical protein UC35_04555 [Ramlibacter tataouinensis]
MPETSFFLPLLLQSAVVPFGVAFAVLVACRAARPDAPAPLLALLAGFLSSYFVTLHAQWSPVPRVALDWLPWIALVGAAAALGVQRIPGAAGRVAVRAVVSLAFGGLIVSSAIGSLGAQKAALAALAIGLILALLWALSSRPARGAATRPLLLALVAGGSGLALMMDSSQSMGQLAGALAMALAACTLFARPRPGAGFAPAAGATAALVLGSLLATAHVYSGFPLGYVALLAGALLVDPALAAIRRGGQSGGLPWVPATVLTAIPVLVTVALTVKAMQESGGY